MRLFALLLLIAVVGKVSPMPRQGPYLGNRQVLYRMAEDESEEDDDVQDDTNTNTNNADESSEEWVNDPNPPAFSKLFPTAPLHQQQQRQKQTGGPGPNGEAFLAVQQEIEQTGWKNADQRHRLRTLGRAGGDFEPKWRAAFRDDDDSEEDDEEEEEEEEERRLEPFGQEAEGPGPQAGPPPQARGFPGNYYRRYRAEGNRVAGTGGQQVYYNRAPVSYAPVSYAPRQPFYAVPARAPVRYTAPRRPAMSYPSRVQGPVRYPQFQSRPVMYNRGQVAYSQRQPVSMYNRRQFYQVPVAMSLPVRRYKSSALHSTQNFYRGPVGNRRQRQYYNRYY